MTHKGGRQLWPSRLKSGDLAQVVGVQLFATAPAVYRMNADRELWRLLHCR
jgi:hypothetical protein